MAKTGPERFSTYRRTATGFVPADDHAELFWRSCGMGEIVAMEARKPRNLKWHRKYWKLMSVIAENSDVLETAEQVHLFVKACLGFGDWVHVPGASKPLFFERSTAFGKMSADDWADYYDKAVGVICRHIMPGMLCDDLKQEIEELLA
jgi:hypothetical protein